MKILVADDDPTNRLVLEKFLVKWNYEVVSARNGDEAWEILQQKTAPPLVILDWMIPGIDGIQLCRLIRANSGPTYTYILLLTAKFQKSDIITALDAGADDYLSKPFDANELSARLRSGKRILELHERLTSSNDQLKFQATHDSLTGFWNRAGILEVLNSELERAKRKKTTLAVFLSDIDHFKKVNDTWGHLAGDAILRETARRMRSTVRSYDNIGRYGGEEFLVVMPECTSAGAIKRAEELRLIVSREPVSAPEGAIPVTVSLGVALGDGCGPLNAEKLLRDADTALYRAKHGGRNLVELFSSLETAGSELQ